MSISSVWQEFSTWWKGTKLGSEIDAAGKATLAELEALAPGIVESVAETTSTALLGGISASSPVADLMAAGVAAAEAAFKAAGAQVASTSITTFVSALHNSVVTQSAAGNVTPATPGADGAAGA